MEMYPSQEAIIMHLTTPAHYGNFVEEIAEVHRLRYCVFKERLDWDVQISGSMEIDEFDALRPVSLIRANDDRIQGCVRLLPSIGPTMLCDNFPVLLGGLPSPASPTIWESSRFAFDIDTNAPKAIHGLASATYELFAGMIEFGLSRWLTDIVTVTDARMERISRRAGWVLRRISEPRRLGSTQAVAGYLEVSAERLTCVRGAEDIRTPVLWAPVTVAA
jgi:acyl homoserine lactone synthase